MHSMGETANAKSSPSEEFPLRAGKAAAVGRELDDLDDWLPPWWERAGKNVNSAATVREQPTEHRAQIAPGTAGSRHQRRELEQTG